MIKMSEHNKISNVILAIGLIMGFAFIVSMTVYLLENSYGLTCSCKASISITIAILTSLGVFVGILTYYFLLKSFSKEKQEIIGNIERTLDFLDSEERKIIFTLIKHNGELAQNNLSKLTNIDSVKLHRKITHLESKKIIIKEKMGMTNKIILNEDFKLLFIK